MAQSVKYMLVDRATNNKYAPIIIGVTVVGGVLLAYFLGRKILESTGVIDTKFDRRIKYLNGFDPNYYKSNMSKVTISTAQAQKIADDVHYSYGYSSSIKPASGTTTTSGGILGGLIAGGTGVITPVLSGDNKGGRNTFFGNDDEERLVGAIRSAGSQSNLSKVSDLFQKKYNVSMVDYIYSFADNADTEAIYKIIKGW